MDHSIVEVQPFFRDVLPKIGSRLHYLIYFVDIGMMALLPAVLYFIVEGESLTTADPNYLLAILIAIAAYSFFAFQSDLYDWRHLRHQLKNPTSTFGAAIFAFGSLLLLGFAFRITNDFSRLWTVLWFCGFCVHVLVSRLGLNWYLSLPGKKRFMSRRAIIIGASDNGQNVLDHILRFDDRDIRVVGFLDDRADRYPKSYRGVPVLGRTHLLEQLVRDKRLDLVIMALPWSAHERVSGLISSLSTWAVDIYMAPDQLGLNYADRPAFRIGGMHVLSLKDRPISEWSAVVKRIEDLCIAIPATILLAPLLALVAVAIKIESKGKAIFIQERYGFNHDLIKVFKFRSMYTDMADRHCDRQTTKDDPRVTKVGRFIRKTSIDELPQLFNVLLGTMSIVGPRPHATGTKSEGKLLEDVVQQYASRHRVKPGITGWAQCNGWRGETDTREKIDKRIEHDLYYIENWSVFLDLLTIVKTFLMMLKRDPNAY